MFLSRKGIRNNTFLSQGMVIDAIGAGYALAVMVHTMTEGLLTYYSHPGKPGGNLQLL